MIRTILLVLIFAASNVVFACDRFPNPFCINGERNPSLVLVYGKVLDTIPNGVRMHVFNVYRGVETQDTISLLNDTYIWCNDTLLFTHSNVGSINDSVYILLSKIDSIVNPWDVVGDYRIPDFGSEFILKVSVDSVRGYIKWATVPFGPETYILPLPLFEQWLQTDLSCAALVTSMHENGEDDKISIYPNPTTECIYISNLPTGATLQLLSLSGQYISEVSITADRISTAHLGAGSYLLKISHEGETGFRRIVKL